MIFIHGIKQVIEDDKYIVEFSDDSNPNVSIRLRDICRDYLSNISYGIVLPMRNYSKVVVPDSGRWFLRYTSIIDFWKNCRNINSDVSDIKNPLYIFLNNSGNVETAFGVIAENVESEFKIIEPLSNRALNVHTGHINLMIKRGTIDYPLNSKNETAKIYIYSSEKANNKTWPEIEKEFAYLQRKRFGLSDCVDANAMEPVWCSWVDWDSKDINTDMLLENIKEGVRLGIKNFIVDDGWYGNGLDSPYDVEMDIGDWEPDKSKIPDMKYLVDETHKMGGKLIIWCAPHAVGKKSKAFSKNKKFLLADSNGRPIINEPRYYSYCLCCKESRKIMADICVDLLEKWDFDGAKYDLFNWIPSVKCENPYHEHDVTSAIEGLKLMLRDVYLRTKAIKSTHIIELKQNYGTVFFSEYGSLMRAGDAPFDDETNFQRTLHIQGYTSKALNDYQSFTRFDSPEDIARAIIKMISVGVPAYGVNFKNLSDSAKRVIGFYNSFFSLKKNIFMQRDFSVSSDNSIITNRCDGERIISILGEGRAIKVGLFDIILNGANNKELVIDNNNGELPVRVYNCYGEIVSERKISNGLSYITVPRGGMLKVLDDNKQ